MKATKVKRYIVGKEYFSDIETAKAIADYTNNCVFDNYKWGIVVYNP